MTLFKCQTWHLPNLMLMGKISCFTHFKPDLRATSNTCIIDFSLSYSDTTQLNIKVMTKK